MQTRTGRQVPRPRLRALLDEAADARLILVSAPAGFGKSTLVADWLDSTNARYAWLALDAGDNDPVRFARYLTAASARLAGGSAPAPEAERALTQAFDPEFVLARVLGDVSNGVCGDGDGDEPRAAVLVLDDFHVIEEPVISGLVASLVELLPRNARLVIATRADPALPLARLRARGELLEVRADDLRFTAPEAAELLRSGGVTLEPDEVQTLTDRTEGWGAVLRLAQVSLRERPDHADLVQRFGATHRYVLDYMVEEVLGSLAEETQEFLLRTSILERMSGPLCEAVARIADGQARLEELERANLLIVPLDDERQWYRYHALFAEMLRARLAASHPEDVAALHARASAWYEERLDDDAAIYHALRSGEVERMSRVVALASGRYINAGELGTMGRALDALPPELVRSHAQLSASYAWYLLTVGRTDGVAERLADAERALAEGAPLDPAMRAGLPTQLAMLRSELASNVGDTETAIAQARIAAELIPDWIPPAHHAILRGMATVLLALALSRAGRLHDAAAAYESAIPDLRAGGNVMALGRAIAELASIAIQHRDPRRALALCEAEIALGDGPNSAAQSPAVWAALATARAELGQADLAESEARHALEVASRIGDAPIAKAAADLLAKLASAPRTAHGAVPSAPKNALVEPLTDREIEVLRLVAVGRSNSQIAAELFVTVGTVKSHLHTISGKLGATNRVEAVARGREAGLLD